MDGKGMGGKGRQAGLSEREKAFCRFYVTSGNAADSARRAGYSAKGATVAGTRCMARDAVRTEIARLQQSARAAVSGLLVPTMEGKPGKDRSVPAEVQAQAQAEANAIVDRNWALAQLVRNLSIAMGLTTVSVTRTVRRADGGTRRFTDKILKPDAAAANRAAELLIKHLPAPPASAGTDTDQIDPQVLAVINGFRSVVTGLAERRAAKTRATDIDQEGNETAIPE